MSSSWWWRLALLSAGLRPQSVAHTHRQRQQQQQRTMTMHPNHPKAARDDYNYHRRLQEQQQQQTEPLNFSVVQELRRTLLEDYDRFSFPFDQIWEEQLAEFGQRKGLTVELGLNFHRVFEVDVASSVADMIVWVRQVWNDPRLRWDPAIYNGTMHFWIGDGQGGGETSEIWAPDIHLWNQETSLDESLADSHALVSSDGTVFWSRPGHVKPVCKFKGLEDFPFDTLECSMEMGSWSYSGLYLRPVRLGEGYTVGGTDTAGEAFTEYKLDSVRSEEFVYPPFPAAPEEDWPVVFYHVSFERAWEPYARGYLVLQIILNLAAFCCFWLPPHVGERMSLSITSVLAAVASELAISANLPRASEITWFAKFSVASMLFTAVTLFESAAVIYFHYHTGDDLVPRWYSFLKKKTKEYRSGTTSSLRSSLARGHSVRFQEEGTREPNAFGSSELSELARRNRTSGEGNNRNGNMGEDETKEFASKDFSLDSDTNSSVRRRKQTTDSSSDDRDSDGDNANHSDNISKIPLGDVKEDGSLSPESTEGAHEARNSGADAMGNQASFASSMTSFRARKSIKTILGRDADDFKNAKEMENNIRWQKVARTIDDYARVIFPVVFALYITVVFAKIDE